MIIGNPTEFAIKYELNKEHGGTWLFGKFCYIVKGKEIGDYEMGASLNDVLTEIFDIIRDAGQRTTNSKMFDLDTTTLYTRLNTTLFGKGNPEYDKIAEEEHWMRFNIRAWDDVFNNYKLFLIEHQDKARMLIGTINEEHIYEVYFKAGEFDKVITQFYQELSHLHEIEVKTKSN